MRVLAVAAVVGATAFVGPVEVGARLGASAALAQPGDRDGILAEAFGPCGDPCRVTYSRGGDLSLFRAAAAAVRSGARRLVAIDGPCLSACALFADMARPRVCVTERARFGFHEVRMFSAERGRDLGRVPPPHSPDIAEWVRSRGGFPRFGMLTMDAGDAARFWPRCRP